MQSAVTCRNSQSNAMIEENEISMMIIGQNYPFFHLPKLLTIKIEGIGLGLGWQKAIFHLKGFQFA